MAYLPFNIDPEMPKILLFSFAVIMWAKIALPMNEEPLKEESEEKTAQRRDLESYNCLMKCTDKCEVRPGVEYHACTDECEEWCVFVPW